MPLLSLLGDIARTVLSNKVAAVGRKYKLPEMNISEKIAPKVYADTSKSFSSNFTVAPSSGKFVGPTVPTSSKSSKSDSSSGDGSSSGGGSSIDNRQREAEEAMNSDRQATLKAIENEYNNLMNSLGNQETALNAQLPLTEQQITQSYGESIPTFEAEKGQKLTDLQTQQSTGEQQAQGVMANTRQLYNELTSGASKFGGSAAQAFGELLGRTTAESLGNTRNALMNLVTSVKGEIGRVNNFYSQKLRDLETNKNLAIEQARQDFRSEINSINAQKTAAQSAKAQQNLAALATFQQNIANIRSAADVAKTALEQWSSSKTKTAQETLADQIKSFASLSGGINSSGLQLTPEGFTNAWSGIQGGDLSNLTGIVSQPKYDSTTGQWVYPSSQGSVVGTARTGNLIWDEENGEWVRQ